MAKASRSNRGSTKEIEKMDWRSPRPLVSAIEAHFNVTFVMDAAASPENSLCLAYITEGMNTLTMPLDRIKAVFDMGVQAHSQRTVHPILHPAVWNNPQYKNSAELLHWIEVGARFAFTYKIPWIYILPASRDEQPWVHETIKWAAQYAYPQGRVNFYNPDGTPSSGGNHPSVIIAFSAPAAGPNQVTSLPNGWRKHLPKKAVSA